MKKLTLSEKVNLALGQDKAIVCSKHELGTRGFSEEYLSQLGLGRNDLKRLERLGVAIRMYTKNVWLPGETMPNGKKAEGTYSQLEVKGNNRKHEKKRETTTIQVPSTTYRGSGSRVQWILLAREG
jgi:hypothetical protein